MRTPSFVSWRFIAMLLLTAFCLLATACGSTTASGIFQHIAPPTPPAQPSTTAGGTSSVSLTISGGTTGTMTVNANPLARQGMLTSYRTTSTKKFLVNIQGTDRQQVLISFLHYTGPGTYQVTGGKASGGVVEVARDQHGAVWLLSAKFAGTCTVMVTSDTVVPGDMTEVGGSLTRVKAVDEVKGTLTCPTLVSLAQGTQPLQVSSGHFDLFMDQLA